MTANKIDTTKYNAMVANASPNVKISSTVFKDFIGDVRSVVDQHADEVNGKVSNSGDTMTGNLAFLGSSKGIEFRNGNNDSYLVLGDFPEATSANVEVRIFRNTNTSGQKRFYLMRGDGSSNTVFGIVNGEIVVLNGVGIKITAGNGSPEGNVTANPGSIYLNRSGGAGVSIYVKESGTGNTGWVAK